MTLGPGRGFGADEETSRSIFDAFAERGGNFVDTANNCTNGASETLVGKFLEGHRDHLVVATKYTLNIDPTNPNGR